MFVIHNQYRLPIKNHGEAGDNHSWLWVKGGLHPRQVTNLLQGQHNNEESNIYTSGQFRVNYSKLHVFGLWEETWGQHSKPKPSSCKVTVLITLITKVH